MSKSSNRKPIVVDKETPSELGTNGLSALTGLAMTTIRKYVELGTIPDTAYYRKGKSFVFRVRECLAAMYVEGKIALTGDLDELPIDSKPKEGGQGSMHDYKISRERIKLKIEILNLQKLEGKLLEKDKVFIAQYEWASALRRNLQLLPQRIIDNVLAASTRKKAELIIAYAIEEVLDTASDMDKLFG